MNYEQWNTSKKISTFQQNCIINLTVVRYLPNKSLDLRHKEGLKQNCSETFFSLFFIFVNTQMLCCVFSATVTVWLQCILRDVIVGLSICCSVSPTLWSKGKFLVLQIGFQCLFTIEVTHWPYWVCCSQRCCRSPLIR